MKMIPKKIIFKENSLPYGQDMQFYHGIPSDVEFNIKRFSNESFKLTAKGYGILSINPKDYGNGAIFVTKKTMNKYLENAKHRGEE